MRVGVKHCYVYNRTGTREPALYIFTYVRGSTNPPFSAQDLVNFLNTYKFTLIPSPLYLSPINCLYFNVDLSSLFQITRNRDLMLSILIE